jgi:hypothetical protein
MVAGMPSLMFPPELLTLIGVNVFVALSLLTSLFDWLFPGKVPYVFQIAALAGFGLIWVNYAFLFFFGEVRFWCSVFFLTVALLAVVAINVYVAVVKKRLGAAIAFLGALTMPVTFLSYYAASSYVNGFALSLPWLPVVPIESLYIVLSSCIVILGLSVIVSFKPETARKVFRIGLSQENASSKHNPALSLKDDPKKDEGGMK